jgi:ABC-2 type transport system ATP-binding protein
MRELLGRLSDEGITIMLSSHLLGEVQQVCTRVAMISHGRIVYEGGMEELTRAAGRRYRLEPTDFDRAATVCRTLAAVQDVGSENGELSFRVDDDEGLVALVAALAQAHVGIRALVRESDSLERLFFELTDEPAEVAA